MDQLTVLEREAREPESPMTTRALDPAMELVLVTDGSGDAERLVRLVTQVVAGGVRAVQLREPGMTASELGELCRVLRPVMERVGGLLLVNDRADLAAAGLAHGVHLGERSLEPGTVRRFLPPDCIVGCSAHDARSLAAAAEQGADYASLSPIFATTCKPGARALGVDAARTLTRAAGLPVIWLGGLDRQKMATLRDCGAAGFALRSALCEAAEPTREAAVLRASLARINEASAP